jgi:ribonuclease BN (tRNA processing enzyme)
VVDRLLAFLGGGGDHPFGRTFRFESISDRSRTTIGDLEVEFSSTDHPVPTMASRWEASGRVMAYSADTGLDGTWQRSAEAADLFLCEATFQESEEGPGHLSAGQAGSVARRAGAHSLMLTHIPPHLDVTRSVSEAEHVFDRPVELAVPGLRRKV